VRIVVGGRIVADRQGGAAAAVMQYAAGFEQLGHEVLLVDEAPSAPGAYEYLARAATAARFGGTFALVHAHGDATAITWDAAEAWVRSADLLVNLGGALRLPALLDAARHRLYVDLDPGFTQLWNAAYDIDMGFDRHDSFASFGSGFGLGPDALPDCGRTWIDTRPPVVLDQWPVRRDQPTYGVTTVANWRSYGSVEHNGVTFGQKAHAWRSLFHLPPMVEGLRVEPALAIDPAETPDIDALRTNGWTLHDPLEVAGDIDSYRSFIGASTAELGIAKSGYVESRCGWFSDRSACYLASGRPVIAHDTGWTAALPSAVGLLPFRDLDDALAAVEAVRSSYDKHCRAAREIAEEFFDARHVLTELIDRVMS
jgi:hypothetical protein